jgi:quinol monooxygenase YgiN
MHFGRENIESFLHIFKSSCDLIRAFPGCTRLELLADKADPCHLTTYSHWQSEEALEHYRKSDLFKSTWEKTKILFDRRPEATSYEVAYAQVRDHCIKN